MCEFISSDRAMHQNNEALPEAISLKLMDAIIQQASIILHMGKSVFKIWEAYRNKFDSNEII